MTWNLTHQWTLTITIVAPNFERPLVLTESCIGYIVVYVVCMVKRYLKCGECLSALTMEPSDGDHSTPAYGLIAAKNRGGLVTPSVSVIRVCEASE